MASAKWHGSTKLQLQPVIKIVERADSTTTIISYRGPWSECIAKKPKVGQTIAGFPGYIESVEPERERGQIGTLTISIRQGNGESSAGTSDQNEVTWELHWEKIQKPLAAHPRYTRKNAGYGSQAFGSAKADDTWAANNPETGECSTDTVGSMMLILAKMDTAAERDAEITKNTSNDQRALVRDYLTKLGKGTEGYNAYTPTLTKRTTSPKRPTATGAGFIRGSKQSDGTISSSPPPNCPLVGSIPNADDFIWYKDGDDVTKTGSKSTYERVEVWLGVDDVDGDLYTYGNG